MGPKQKPKVKRKVKPKVKKRVAVEVSDENTYSKQLQELISKIKNQSLESDNGIRFGWKNN